MQVDFVLLVIAFLLRPYQLIVFLSLIFEDLCVVVFHIQQLFLLRPAIAAALAEVSTSLPAGVAAVGLTTSSPASSCAVGILGAAIFFLNSFLFLLPYQLIHSYRPMRHWHLQYRL